MVSEDAGATGAVARARVAMEAGEAWRARDVLTAHVSDTKDLDALNLLGSVLHSMGDLPGTGAAWFGSGARGDEVDVAVSAWREKYDDDFGDMWRSLPTSVRRSPRAPKVEALREKAMAADAQRETAKKADPTAHEGIDAAQVIAWSLAAFFVVCSVVGLVTILRLLFPGS